MYDMMNTFPGARRMAGETGTIYPTGNAERKEDVFGMEPIALGAAPAALCRPVKHVRKISSMYTEGDRGFITRYII